MARTATCQRPHREAKDEVRELKLSASGTKRLPENLGTMSDQQQHPIKSNKQITSISTGKPLPIQTTRDSHKMSHLAYYGPSGELFVPVDYIIFPT